MPHLIFHFHHDPFRFRLARFAPLFGFPYDPNTLIGPFRGRYGIRCTSFDCLLKTRKAHTSSRRVQTCRLSHSFEIDLSRIFRVSMAKRYQKATFGA
ncbi:hypothetical protein I7I48_07138 [Histoplasma ohiense]|nr:hypothetical protein I7I48_07138 [Histoplasma ohiense (nom. inval.)]